MLEQFLKEKQGFFIKTGLITLVAIIVLFILYPFVTIGPGERGVVFSKISGIQSIVLNEGLNFKIPFIDTVEVIDVKTKRLVFGKAEDQKVDGSFPVLSAASSDLQDVFISATITYRPNPLKIGVIYQTVGLDYETKKIVPLVIDLIKTHTAKYKVEEILRNREKIKSAVQEDLLKSLDKENIILESVNLTNFDFNPEFKKRIEAKQIEEKDKETAQVTLEKKTIEAQQKVEIAKADAEAEIAAAEGKKKSDVLKAEGEKEAKILEGQAIQEYNKLIQQQVSAQVLEYKKLENQKAAIDKWSGNYPSTYMGEGNRVPLINIGN